MLIRIIAQYLQSHRRLIVPQLGAFIVKEAGGSILFSELLKRDDGVLRQLLVEKGMSELEAGGEVDRFVFEVRHAIRQGQEYPLEGLGVLKPGPNETIAFVCRPQPAAQPEPPAPAAPATVIDGEFDFTPRKLSTAVETLYSDPKRAGQHTPERLAATRPATTTTAAPTASATSGHAGAAEKKPSEEPAKLQPQKQEAFSLTEQPAKPYFKPLSLPKFSKRDDLGDSYYGRLPRRPAIEQTVRVKKRSDHFIWIALIAALIAAAAIAFGYWCDTFGREGDEALPEFITPAPGDDALPMPF